MDDLLEIEELDETRAAQLIMTARNRGLKLVVDNAT